jgi:hypothetical protein
VLPNRRVNAEVDQDQVHQGQSQEDRGLNSDGTPVPGQSLPKWELVLRFEKLVRKTISRTSSDPRVVDEAEVETWVALLIHHSTVAGDLEAISVFQLQHFEGLTLREVAEVMKIPPGTANSRFAKAKEVLQEAVRKGWHRDPTAGPTMRCQGETGDSARSV